MDTILQISKLDAAKRQLETVIRLYFSHGDPVAIHTLVAASYNVIRDINKRRGGKKLLMKDQFMDYVRDEHRKEVRKKINQAENFFKHADRDYDDTIEFNPRLSELLLFESCAVYVKLTGEFPPLLKLYHYWFLANHRNLFKFTKEKQLLMDLGVQELHGMGREQYFNLGLPLISRIDI